VLEVGDPLVEVPLFQTMANGCELFIFMLDFSDDGMSVSFELGLLLVVTLIPFNLCRGCEVKATNHHSQSKEGGPCGLEKLLAPIGHGVQLSV